jgi:hypothetical protein
VLVATGQRGGKLAYVDRDLERPRGPHRLHRVGAQVHDDLVDLGRIAEHAGVAGADRAPEHDAGRQRRADGVERLVDDRLHVHRHALCHAAAAEREDALDERLGAHAGGQRGIDVATQCRPFGGVLLRQLAVAENRRQDVVEVVRDAAGERADRLELLRLAQLQLEAVALGLGALASADVLHRARHSIGLAAGVAQRDAALAIPVPFARVMAQAVFDPRSGASRRAGARGSRTARARRRPGDSASARSSSGGAAAARLA